MGDMGDNVRYNKLLHEFKALYPLVPDEIVRNCVRLHGHDKQRCNDVLAAESERSVPHHGGPAYNRVQSADTSGFKSSRRRLSLQQALLNQQMQRQLILRDEFNRESGIMSELRSDVIHLTDTLNHRQMQIREEIMGEPPEALESNVTDLQDSCIDLEDRLKLLCNRIEETPGVSHIEVDSPSRVASTSPQPRPPQQQQTLGIGRQSPPTAGASSDSSPVVVVDHDPRKHSLEAAFASVLGPVASTSLPAGARLQDPAAAAAENEEEEEEVQWPCAACTYLNHPLLKTCEQCSMPRFMVGTSDSAATSHQDNPCFCHPQTVTAAQQQQSPSSEQQQQLLLNSTAATASPSSPNLRKPTNSSIDGRTPEPANRS